MTTPVDAGHLHLLERILVADESQINLNPRIHPMSDPKLDAIQAATFRHLVAHLQERTDVQNIDLMDLAGFCRNCLSKWMRAEAEKQGVEISDPDAREAVYGMPYDEWKAKYQK